MGLAVLIMHNIPSRQGYYYVFFIIDHATKMCCIFPLKTGESKHFLAYLKHLRERGVTVS